MSKSLFYGNNVIGQIPDDWDKVRIDDQLVESLGGFSCAKKNMVPVGVTHLRPFNITTKGEVIITPDTLFIPEDYRDDLERFHLEENDILYNNTNSIELVGKSGIVVETMQVAYSNHINRLRVINPHQISPKWLALCLRNLREIGFFATYCNKWIGQAGFSITMLSDVEIPLPDIEKQLHIVSLYESLIHEISEMRVLNEKIGADSDLLIRSVLWDIFDVQYSDKETIKLSELCDVVMGQSPPGSSYRDSPEGLPLINGPTEFGEDHPTPVQWTLDPKKECQSGDLLFCVRGATTGRMNWADQVYAIGRGVAAIRSKEGNHTNLSYIRYLLEHQSTKILESGRGSTFPNFSKSQLLSIDVPHITPTEQEKISTYIGNILKESNELAKKNEADSTSITLLEQSILTQTFRGEL